MTYRLQGSIGHQFMNFKLEDGRHRVGRSADNQIVLIHGTVSREHAEIRISGDRIEIEDLGSRNGTFVNGHRITGSAEIQSGSHIRLGSVDLVLEGAEGATARGTVTDVTPRRVSDGTVLFEGDQALSSRRVSWNEVQSEIDTGSYLERSLFRVVTEAGSLIVRPQRIEEVFDAILRMAASIIPARRILILLQEAEETEPVVRAVWPSEQAANTRIMLSHTLLQSVLQGRESLLVTDAQIDPRFAGQASIVAQQIRSALVAPLFDNEHVLGLIYADTNDPTLHYDEDQLRAFTMFANLTAVKITNTRLLETEREKERMEQEIATAARIQTSLLPASIPAVGGYEIVVHQTPCLEMGGDLYDTAELPGGKMALAVGDVSGKGLGAAMLMSHVMASMRLLYEEPLALDEMMTRIHGQILRSSDAAHFVTLFIARLDPSTHRLEYVSAGHNPAFLIQADGSVSNHDATGMPAGLMAGATFATAQIDLEPGSIACIYSDGVTEAQDASDEFFGEERLIECLKRRREQPLDEILEGLLADLYAFLGEESPNDDITILLVKRASAA